MKSKRKVLLALTIAQHAYYRGIVRYAKEQDWHLVMDMVYTGRVPRGWYGDGILTILGYRKDLVDFIKTASVPTVALTLINEQIPLPRVEGDNLHIGQLAAEHFLERGYRHFAWAPFLNDVMDTERLAGFCRTLTRQGFACQNLPAAHAFRGRVWQDNWTERRRRLITELRRLPRPTAIFAYNDCVAADIIDACRDADLLVPEEMAVLGVDNDPDICDCAPVPLSSVMHNLEGMAYAGAALLDRLMRGHQPPKEIHRIPPLGVVTRVSTDIRAVDNVNVAVALRYISENFPNRLLSVTDVAGATSLSRRQLERDFRQEMHCSINEHLTHTRLQYVQRQLAESTDKVVDISRQAGFTRPNHLFRVFRSRFSISPKKYRLKAQTRRSHSGAGAAIKPSLKTTTGRT